MIGVILLRCASRVIHRFMQREETVGITTDVYRGRDDSNLYRSISYRTAGGCCVCSREMEYGGSSLKIH